MEGVSSSTLGESDEKAFSDSRDSGGVRFAWPFLRCQGRPAQQASEHQQLSADQIAAFTDARIAALKAGLKLTPAQEKNWPALESALREIAKDRAARAVEWREKAKEHHEKRDLIEGFRLGAKHLSARSAELEKIADAAKPLYDGLDDAQKHRFGVLLHEVFSHHDTTPIGACTR